MAGKTILQFPQFDFFLTKRAYLYPGFGFLPDQPEEEEEVVERRGEPNSRAKRSKKGEWDKKTGERPIPVYLFLGGTRLPLLKRNKNILYLVLCKCSSHLHV